MSLIDDTCDGCGERFDPMGDPYLVRAPRPGEPWRVLLGRCATNSAPRPTSEAAMSDQIQRLREVAEAATTRGPWVSAEQTHGEWFGLQSPYVALGTAFERGDAEHIATFDPPTVLELLDRLERAEVAVERVRPLFDDSALECGGLGLPCTNIYPAQRWCRGCQLRDALGGPGEARGGEVDHECPGCGKARQGGDYEILWATGADTSMPLKVRRLGEQGDER